MEGRVIADRYRLEEAIGKGAMGTVWRAEHLALRMPVAVKIIHAEAARNAKALARFGREARVAAKIRSDHVVKMLDHGHDGDTPFIVMEWLEGESLRSRLDQRGHLDLHETARVVTHVCRALSQAHAKGLIHRDIKPGNVFAAPGEDDQADCYKVLDFGVAKVTDGIASVQAWPTRTGTLVGTPYYISPEQARGLKSLDHRADLWSVAVVCFECLTGQRPFRAKALGPLVAELMEAPIPPPSELAPDGSIPPEVDAWMDQGLSRDPTTRFESAKQMADAFRMAVGYTEATDSPPSSASGADPERPTDPVAAMPMTVRGLGPPGPSDGAQGAAAPQALDVNKTVALADAAAIAATEDRRPARERAEDDDPQGEKPTAPGYLGKSGADRPPVPATAEIVSGAAPAPAAAGEALPGAPGAQTAGSVPATVAVEPLASDAVTTPPGVSAPEGSGPLVVGPDVPGQGGTNAIHPYEELEAAAARGALTDAELERQSRLRWVVAAVVGFVALAGVAAAAIAWFASRSPEPESADATPPAVAAPTEPAAEATGDVAAASSLEPNAGQVGVGGATGSENGDESTASPGEPPAEPTAAAGTTAGAATSAPSEAPSPPRPPETATPPPKKPPPPEEPPPKKPPPKSGWRPRTTL